MNMDIITPLKYVGFFVLGIFVIYIFVRLATYAGFLSYFQAKTSFKDKIEKKEGEKRDGKL